MKEWFKVVAQAGIGEIYIYGEITDIRWFDEDVTPAYIKDELDKLKNVTEINVYVNSPGGNVFAGVAIYNMLKRTNKPITAYVDGVAASIASVIVLAADTVIMPVNSMLMIHNPWMIAAGNANDFRTFAEKLDKITDSVIVESYVEKTGMEVADLKKMLDEETWLSAKEAKELGFADVIEEEQKIAACYKGENVVAFNNVALNLDNFKTFPKAKFEEHKKQMSLKQRCEHDINVLSAQL